MTRMRAGIAIVACCLAVQPVFAQSSATGNKPAADLVNQLTSDRHQTRERALVTIVQAGAASVPALLKAAVSKDPELAWRAGETLQVLGQTADAKVEGEVKKELLKASRANNPAEAVFAKKILAKWPVLRHHYAATQLELLGAEIADNPMVESQEVLTVPGGFIPAGGVFFAGIMPALADDGPELVELVEVLEAAVEEEVVEAEVAADVAADEPAAKPLFGDLIKVLGRAAGKFARDDKAAGAALTEAIEERLMPAAAVEVMEEPVADPIDVDGIDIIADVEFVEARDLAPLVDVPHSVTVVEGAAPETDQLQPGTLRIGKEWRGGDAGLEYAAQLQQIHTVILREAPLTDAALSHLRNLRSLNQLQVQRTRLSSAALMKFRQQRPEVIITAVGPAVLGVSGSDHPSGLLVHQVIPETGARRAGIDEQDIITKIDGLAVKSFHDVTLALYDKRPNAKVKVEFLRGGKRKVADILLTERQSAQAVDSAVAAPPYASPVHHFIPGLRRAMPVPFGMPE